MAYNSTVWIGDLLVRQKYLGFVEHLGVAVENSQVLQNTPEKGEHVSTMDEFSAGQRIEVRHTNADPAQVIARKNKILSNPKKYNVLFRNCQHTASEAIKGIAESPVLILLGVVVLVIGGVIVIRRLVR